MRHFLRWSSIVIMASCQGEPLATNTSIIVRDGLSTRCKSKCSVTVRVSGTGARATDRIGKLFGKPTYIGLAEKVPMIRID